METFSNTTHDATISKRYSPSCTLVLTRLLTLHTSVHGHSGMPKASYHSMHAHILYSLPLDTNNHAHNFLVFSKMYPCTPSYRHGIRFASLVYCSCLFLGILIICLVEHFDTRCILFCPVNTFVNKSPEFSSDRIHPINNSLAATDLQVTW